LLLCGQHKGRIFAKAAKQQILYALIKSLRRLDDEIPAHTVSIQQFARANSDHH